MCVSSKKGHYSTYILEPKGSDNKLILFVVIFILCKRIVNSPFGRVLIAIRENEQRTSVLGYNTAKYRITIYCISGGIAGLRGAMFGPINAIVYLSLFWLFLSFYSLTTSNTS